MKRDPENRPRIEKLARQHDTACFNCGQDNLNHYLRRYALMNQGSDAGQTYVGMVGERIIGYYTLVVGMINYVDAPERLKKGLSRNPVPVMLLARLAIDLEWQRQGVGAGLLRNAMQRSVQVADIAGVRAMLVHAKDDKAKTFYEHFDFEPSPTDPYHLYLLIKYIRKAMGL